MPRSTPTSPRVTIDALTGVRAFAAAWVVLYHFWSICVTLVPSAAPLHAVVGGGYVGVDLFFVLSGFIISYNYLDTFSQVNSASYFRFLWLRLARFYPVHLFALLVVGCALISPTRWGETLRSDPRFTLVSLLRNLALLAAWGRSSFSWNGPAWSISAEWFAYLLFPAAALLLNRFRSSRLALWGASLAIPATLLLFLVAIPRFLSLESAWPLVRIAGCFAAGTFVCVLFKQGWQNHRNWDVIALATIAALLAAQILLVSRGMNALVATPLMPLLILALAKARGGLARVLGSRPVIYLGKVSYALYMTHLLVREVVFGLIPPAAFVHSSLVVRLVVCVGYLAAAVVAAALVYHLVEEPARRSMRGRLRTTARNRSASAVVAN
ncbi:MAG: acyltransferase [Myxococcales bacterium]